MTVLAFAVLAFTLVVWTNSHLVSMHSPRCVPACSQINAALATHREREGDKGADALSVGKLDPGNLS